MLHLFQLIFSKDNVAPYGDAEKRVCMWGSVILAFVSFLLTSLNVAKRYWFMTGTTVFLIVGFLAAALFAYKNKLTVCRVLLAVICAVMFSIYAITGENDGFAILWILLVPVLASFLIGLQSAFFLSSYFQVFLIVLFYTPLSQYVTGYYSDTFMMRFPLLYFASFVMITFMMCHRQQLLNDIDKQANMDMLTGMFNRNRYDKVLKNVEDKAKYPHLTILAFDLNQLKEINDRFGHEAGDELIRAAAEIIRNAFDGDLCFRTGGDEFMVISQRKEVSDNIQKMKTAMDAWQGTWSKSIHISVGAASRDETPSLTTMELCKLADQKMYADKSEYYRSNGLDRRRAR